MLYEPPSIAVVTTSTQNGVEGLQRFGVHLRDRKGAQQRPDVLIDLRDVAPTCRDVHVGDLEPTVEELVDRGARAGIAPLVYLRQQPRTGLLDLPAGVAPGGMVSVR